MIRGSIIGSGFRSKGCFEKKVFRSELINFFNEINYIIVLSNSSSDKLPGLILENFCNACDLNDI